MMLEVTPARSFRIFPLHGIVNGACTCALGAECKSIGKHPIVAWRTYDENTKGPSGGYGIQTGHFNGIFVVDLDVSESKNGIAALTSLGDVPDTLSVLTPSGGVHLYFRLPLDLHVPCSRSELGLGIDVKGEGGYVVGPGSPHKRGGFYQAVPEALADPPDWLLEKVIKKPPSLSKAPAPRASGLTPPDSTELVAALLAKAWPAEGRGRHPAQLALAGALCRDGWSEDDAVELLCAVCGAAGDEDRPKRSATCRDTWMKADSGALFTGWKELSKYVGDGVVSAARTMLKSKTEQAALERFRENSAATAAAGPKTPNPEHEYTFEIGMRGSGETRRATLGEVISDLVDHKDWAGVLTFDVFKDRVVAINPPMKMDAEIKGLSDDDVTRVQAWFEYHGKKISEKDTQRAIRCVARKNETHGPRDWLLEIGSKWDGKPRLDRVLPDYFQTRDSAYERGIGPRWFISLVARAMEPGCQVDCVLILEGATGYRKSSAFRTVVPSPHWYAQSSCGVEKKDFYENLRSVWLMGFDELASLSKASMDKTKTELTELCDHYRPSYGRNSESYPRSNCFCGTTNEELYLNDPTGGRRFWPVKVLQKIDTDKIEQDREQLFAEAFVRYSAKEPWHVDTPELEALCETEQEDRFEVDSWEEVILRWLNDPTKFSRKRVVHEPGSVFKGVAPFDGSEGFTTADVLHHAINKPTNQQTKADPIRVGVILRRLKMQTMRVRVPGGRERRYVFSTPE